MHDSTYEISIMIIRLGLLFLYVANVQAIEKIRCPHSLITAKYNVKCPATKIEWEERAKLYNCEQQMQNCTAAEKYKYHCVLNAKGDATVELCAPVVDIIGGQCTEFTVGGQFLQEHAEKKCKSCPFKYISSNVYKYKECYQLQKRVKLASYSVTASKNVRNSTITAIQYSKTPIGEGHVSLKGDQLDIQIKDDKDPSEEPLENHLIILMAVVFILVIAAAIVLYFARQNLKRCLQNTFHKDDVHEKGKENKNNDRLKPLLEKPAIDTCMKNINDIHKMESSLISYTSSETKSSGNEKNEFGTSYTSKDMFV